MFYERFITLCNRAGIKPTALLKRLGLTYGNLTRWKKGASVNLGTVKAIADYFGVSIDYFFGDGNEKKNTKVTAEDLLSDVTDRLGEMILHSEIRLRDVPQKGQTVFNLAVYLCIQRKPQQFLL